MVTRLDLQFEQFKQFVLFFSRFFAAPNPLTHVQCRQSYKEYVPRYYAKLFGGQQQLTARHMSWFHRLEPLLSLPPGSRLLDFGGGYGLDAIFLATLGFELTLYELTEHHLAIARELARAFSDGRGTLNLAFVRAPGRPSHLQDAVLLNEVAHHIEPANRIFSQAATMLKDEGRLFLLEPNFFSLPVQLFFLRVRGLSTVEHRTDEETGESYLWGNEHIRPVSRWRREAEREGFQLAKLSYTLPGISNHFAKSSIRRVVQELPGVRTLLSNHVAMQFSRGPKKTP